MLGRERELQELFRIPEEVKQQLNSLLHNYNFSLMEADYVNPANYQTDLREFFQAMQCRRDKRRLKGLCQTESFQNLSRETEIIISAHLEKEKLFQQVEEGIPMCKALDDWIKEERENGRQEGAKEGVKQEKSRVLRRMLQAGLEEALIMQILNCTKEELAAAK